MMLTEEEQRTFRARQETAVSFDALQATTVSVIGCGAIGSFATYALAKLGVGSFHLYDPDTVDAENVGCQLFSTQNIDESKVDALKHYIIDDAGVTPRNVYAYEWPVTADTRLPAADVTLACVDSLAARRQVWQVYRRMAQNNTNPSILIDARMGLEILHLFTISLLDQLAVNEYCKSLEGEELELPCSARSIVYCPQIAGGFIAHAVKRFIGGDLNSHEMILDIAEQKLYKLDRR